MARQRGSAAEVAHVAPKAAPRWPEPTGREVERGQLAVGQRPEQRHHALVLDPAVAGQRERAQQQTRRRVIVATGAAGGGAEGVAIKKLRNLTVADSFRNCIQTQGDLPVSAGAAREKHILMHNYFWPDGPAGPKPKLLHTRGRGMQHMQRLGT